MPPSLNHVFTGEIRGQTTTSEQLPNIPCVLVKFKALAGNLGNVYLGGTPNTVKANTSPDNLAGLQMGPGDDSGWIPIDNLNKLYLISDNASDTLTYMALY